MITIKQMTDEALLDAYASLERWAGDDFAINQIGRKELNRAAKIRVAILARMAMRHSAAVNE